MSKLIQWAIGAAVLVAAALVLHHFWDAREADWLQRVERVQATAAANLAQADAAVLRADSIQIVADSLAVEASVRDTVIERMIVELPTPPEDCLPFTLPRDDVILEVQAQNADIWEAYSRQVEANIQLRLAQYNAHVAADSLSAVLADYPKQLSPLIPSVGLGATAGICTTGQPCVAVGLSLQWRIKL